MSALLLAVVVIAVLLAVAVAVAMPRLRAGRGRRPLAARRPSTDGVAASRRETEVADDARRPREERRLIAEGEAIREHVEARLAATERRPAYAVDPLVERDELARQLEQEQRERYPATYGTAGAGYVAPADDPVDGPPAVPGGPVQGARDELAWQIERDRRERHPADYPVGGGLRPVGPAGSALQPAMPPVSDALELQLQEVAVRSRGGRPAGGRRFVRSRRGAVDPEDPRLAE